MQLSDRLVWIGWSELVIRWGIGHDASIVPVPPDAAVLVDNCLEGVVGGGGAVEQRPNAASSRRRQRLVRRGGIAVHRLIPEHKSRVLGPLLADELETGRGEPATDVIKAAEGQRGGAVHPWHQTVERPLLILVYL